MQQQHKNLQMGLLYATKAALLTAANQVQSYGGVTAK